MQEKVVLNNDELRIARAIARADAATDRLNKICDLLEIRFLNNEMGDGGQGAEMTCDRMSYAEDAILELAEAIGEIM